MSRLFHLTIILLFVISPVLSAVADDNYFIAHYRPRPPEMIIDEKSGHFSGPLIDILNEAAEKIGFKISWYRDDFKNSYLCLQKGCVDIVPRVILTKERKAFVHYLGPIAHQQKNIYFLVHKNQEKLIRAYEDLYALSIGVKQHAAYFERFNKDNKLNKIPLRDDQNMAKMFIADRFDTMAVLDVMAIEKALANLNYTNYGFAEYFYAQKIENYYGFSKNSPKAEHYKALNNTLKDMANSGRIMDIYKQYGVTNLIK